MWQIMYTEGDIEEIDEADLFKKLANNYTDVDAIMNTALMNKGLWVRTSSFSHFRWIEKLALDK